MVDKSLALGVAGSFLWASVCGNYRLNKRLYAIFQQGSPGLQIGIVYLLYFQNVFLPRILLDSSKESLEEDLISSNIFPNI